TIIHLISNGLTIIGFVIMWNGWKLIHGAKGGLVTEGAYAYVDSVGKPLSPETNLYQYTGNNPINYTDPLGLFTWVNPITYWRDFVGGVGDFQDNYIRMVDANIIGADKYYHCMANCQASRRGVGGSDAAGAMSEGRELFDEYVKGDPRSVCDEDRAANRHGRKSNSGMPCATLCAPLIHPMWKPK
ncbi:MAG: hypothetical protein HY265_08735, partial [Deltaproteobacteria bacterium]|nr:hypothetical protein [Deltaproteobacteria bacterium]